MVIFLAKTKYSTVRRLFKYCKYDMYILKHPKSAIPPPVERLYKNNFKLNKVYTGIIFLDFGLIKR